MIIGLTKNYYTSSSMQKISSIHQFILDKADFKVSGPKRCQPYLSMCIPKVTFSFLDTMYEHGKKLAQFIYPFTLWPGWPQSFLTTTTAIFFYQLLIFGIEFHHFVLEKYFIWNPAIWSPTSFSSSMTEKQTNRFTDFTFG